MKHLIFAIVLLPMASFAQTPATVPGTEITYNLTEQYNYGYNVLSNARLNGVHGTNQDNDFNIVYSNNRNFDLLVIDGNIRFGGTNTYNADANIFVLPGSESILSISFFMSGDTVFNYGTLTLNGFKSQDSIIVINGPGAKLICENNGEMNPATPGESIAGDCKSGYLVVYETNAGIQDGTTGTNDITAAKMAWETYQLYDLSGKLVKAGKWSKNAQYSQTPGTYILRLSANGNSKASKIFIH